MSFLFRDEDTTNLVGASLLGGSFELPRLVAKERELEHNIALMMKYCAVHGASIAPHAKTTMAPSIIRRQLAAGAWGVTVATMQQLRVCLDIGAERIILANQLVNPTAAEWLGQALLSRPNVEVYCLVDSASGAARLSHGLRTSGTARRLPVLVEVGVTGGRAGCRSLAQTSAVAHVIAEHKELTLVGVEGFEGILGGGRTSDELARVDEFLELLVDCAISLESEGMFGDHPEILLSAGGSMYFDRVAETFTSPELQRRHRTVLRSGCYVTHDHGNYSGTTPLSGIDDALDPALELWSEIVSVPEHGSAIANFGKRDTSFDAGLPVPLAKLRVASAELESCDYVRVSKLNDQHAYLDTSAGPDLAIGERLICGILHPCTAFDKWRQVLLVDEEYSVQEIIDTSF